MASKMLKLLIWMILHMDNGTFCGMVWFEKSNGTFSIYWAHKRSPLYEGLNTLYRLAWVIYRNVLYTKNDPNRKKAFRDVKSLFRNDINKQDQIEIMENLCTSTRLYYRFINLQLLLEEAAAVSEEVKTALFNIELVRICFREMCAEDEALKIYHEDTYGEDIIAGTSESALENSIKSRIKAGSYMSSFTTNDRQESRPRRRKIKKLPKSSLQKTKNNLPKSGSKRCEFHRKRGNAKHRILSSPSTSEEEKSEDRIPLNSFKATWPDIAQKISATIVRRSSESPSTVTTFPNDDGNSGLLSENCFMDLQSFGAQFPSKTQIERSSGKDENQSFARFHVEDNQSDAHRQVYVENGENHSSSSWNVEPQQLIPPRSDVHRPVYGGNGEKYLYSSWNVEPNQLTPPPSDAHRQVYETHEMYDRVPNTELMKYSYPIHPISSTTERIPSLAYCMQPYQAVLPIQRMEDLSVVEHTAQVFPVIPFSVSQGQWTDSTNCLAANVVGPDSNFNTGMLLDPQYNFASEIKSDDVNALFTENTFLDEIFCALECYES